MNVKKSKNTLIALEAALERIVQGSPKHISSARKLSVRAVEEEANLGNGSGYYYPEIIEKVRRAKADVEKENGGNTLSEIKKARKELNNQKRIKNDYREKNTDLKNIVKQLSSNLHHLNNELRTALTEIKKLEMENANLRDELAKEKRGKVTLIK
jgi:chromosome segregation ATPase